MIKKYIAFLFLMFTTITSEAISGTKVVVNKICPAGQEAATTCTPCKDGYYKAFAGTGNCTKCTSGLTNVAKTYCFNSNNHREILLKNCPTDADCTNYPDNTSIYFDRLALEKKLTPFYKTIEDMENTNNSREFKNLQLSPPTSSKYKFVGYKAPNATETIVHTSSETDYLTVPERALPSFHENLYSSTEDQNYILEAQWNPWGLIITYDIAFEEWVDGDQFTQNPYETTIKINSYPTGQNYTPSAGKNFSHWKCKSGCTGDTPTRLSPGETFDPKWIDETSTPSANFHITLMAVYGITGNTRFKDKDGKTFSLELPQP